MLPLDRQNAYREKYRTQTPGWRTSGEVYEALVRRYVSRPASLLDLGCGRGGVIELVHADLGLPVGLDPDLHSLREHRQPRVRRVCGLADCLPFPAASFDLVTAAWLFEHLPSPEAAFAEVARVLRPGRQCVFLTPNALNPIVAANRRLAPALQRRLVPRLYGRAEADTFRVRYAANTAARIERLARRAGLRLSELHLVGDPTYLAFNDILYTLSAFAERLLPRGWKVHLVGVIEKPA